MTHDIPPLRRPEDMPAVRTQADLHRHWRAMMGELGFGQRQLWFQFFDADGRCTPVVQQVTDVPELPDTEMLANLMAICDQLLTDLVPDGSVAFLWARPGRPGLIASDRAWAAGLAKAAADAGVRSHPVHLANDHELRVFATDDEIASA
ncbi:hypothetical protein DDE18_17605 [Nocardioides gansuensis]|uniref:Uncharacterized protein n=1 Tax=Nocardioides gansuensis TaxID=2138300 RepID=A0A2T8F7T4_9ACTN|nr:hypothetical protein [Nocardioides gansuensis]PVG81781.1 hypothetical protein DDE18_17605 [Nocardioides gansuensis]